MFENSTVVTNHRAITIARPLEFRSVSHVLESASTVRHSVCTYFESGQPLFLLISTRSSSLERGCHVKAVEHDAWSSSTRPAPSSRTRGTRKARNSGLGEEESAVLKTRHLQQSGALHVTFFSCGCIPEGHDAAQTAWAHPARDEAANDGHERAATEVVERSKLTSSFC